MTAAAAPQPSDKPHPHDHHMITLYYCYPPISIPTDQLKPHANFHQETCTSLNLFGRIRVSQEGINGVLSGTEENLREYEDRLRKELMLLVSSDENFESTNENEDDPTSEWLDMKYCHLRKDISMEKQLFDTLSVKTTREVVSLIEPVAEKGKKNGRARCRQRRKQKRKEKQRLERLKLKDDAGEAITDEGNDSTTIGDHGEEKKLETAEKSRSNDEAQGPSSLTEEMKSITIGQCQEGLANTTVIEATKELGTALPIQDWEKRTPAVHLSPQEWNEKLFQLSQEKHDQSENITNTSSSDSSDAQNLPMGEDAILLDTRNIYETRVGHFAVPNLETFFPNTRKFSSLPNALNTEEAAEALAGKQVFMYCTGGVRCERAGSYLRALSESNDGAWKDKEQPKGIYQLRGGIQKYLEAFGREEEEEELVQADVKKPSTGEDGAVEEENETVANNKAAKPCLYRGKNFVFDPRRTDPLIGNGITSDCATANGRELVSLVGRCIVCSTPHDDYDNGHAPCEEKEARCLRCRCLVLVCDGCRLRVRCWGEPDSSDEGRDTKDDIIHKMDLFCGHGGGECIDEGNIAEKVETTRF